MQEKIIIFSTTNKQNCPVLYPSWKEFKNFSQYVQYLDKTYKQEYGMVKVVPPPQWKPSASAYQNKLKGLMINGPIEQNIFGKGGVYQCMHIQKKSLSLQQYQNKMAVFDKLTEGLSADQIEDRFWKNIVFSPPLYGADLMSTLMDSTASSWDLNNLESILKHAVKNTVRGVTNPYCYVGCWKAMFCWHKQDLDLSAINYLHEGRSKFWYSIPYNQHHILQKEARTFFPQHFNKCSQHLRHKTTLINPYNLKKKYPQLRITKTQHKAGEFMLVLGGSYHCGFNSGFNIAEAVNYATVRWLQQLVMSQSCKCSKKSVKASWRQILDNLSSSPWAGCPQMKQFRKAVEKQQSLRLEQQQKQQQAIGVRNQFVRKARKEKKIHKLRFKGDEYEINHWAACQECGQWRKLSYEVGENERFSCKEVNKRCYVRDRHTEEYITL